MNDKLDQSLLRAVAGGFPTGVTIVTTEKSDGTVKGLTASSFVSISLDPALVGFFIMNDASLMEEISINKKLSISILSADQKAISNQFAGQNKVDIKIDFTSNNQYHHITDALAWYETVVADIIPAGDHQLIMCKVIALGRDHTKPPLVYYSGYKEIGADIT